MPIDVTIWKDLPYFIAGGLILYGLFRLLSGSIVKFAEIWKDVSFKRNEIDNKRNEIEDRSLTMLTKLSETLDIVAKRQIDSEKVAIEQGKEIIKQGDRLTKHDEAFVLHNTHQSEIRQYIIDVQTSLNKLIEYSKTVPQLNEQIKTGFEEMAKSIKEIRVLINGVNEGKKEEGSSE